MKTYIISDTHFNHANIKTYCQRPDDFTKRLIVNWRRIVRPEDEIIHLGDVFMHKAEGWREIWPQLTGRKTLIRGNHDRKKSCTWWMENGFDFACDSLILRRVFLTHEPAYTLPAGCTLNIHGHLHNIWDGFLTDPIGNSDLQGRLRNPWQRLFAVEYTNYEPVEFEKFIGHPERYKAIGPKDRKPFEQ